jgi:hypothetical protein
VVGLEETVLEQVLNSKVWVKLVSTLMVISFKFLTIMLIEFERLLLVLAKLPLWLDLVAEVITTMLMVLKLNLMDLADPLS